MGKKRRLKKHPLKFGKKFANYPGFDTEGDIIEEVVEPEPVMEKPVPKPSKTKKRTTTKKTTKKRP